MKLDVVEVSQERIDEALAKAKAALEPEVFTVFDSIVRAHSALLEVLKGKNTSIRRLRRMLFGPTSEKSEKVLVSEPGSPGEGRARGEGSEGGASKANARRTRPPGHGRNGHDAYWGAEKECVPHHKLKPGDRCPACGKGRVYERKRPKVLVRVTGQPPLAAKVLLLTVLRCNLCEKLFPARRPKGVGRRKYDASAGSMIGLLRYGGGFPWSRLHKLQGAVGVPLPPSTQWDIVRGAARMLEPVYEALERLAAQGRVLHNDDTPMKILAWMGKRREASLQGGSKKAGGCDGDKPGPGRTGIFTSGVISRVEGRRIALFFTGLRHAGENLKSLLTRRSRGLGPPIQMCDALSRNSPKELKTILANCIAHGRRQFVEQAGNFPSECGHVLGVLAEVYKHDAIAKKRGMNDTARLRFHQEKSGPLMEKLHAWMQAQIAEKKIEPNSGMGEAIGYMLKHWEKLTLFLKKAGAPLDNNICERALKKAILHRKNSLFYKTDNGARVGDIFMSLIYTCDLSGADPFDYLTQIQRYAKQVRALPEQWLPWNYRQSIAAREPPP